MPVPFKRFRVDCYDDHFRIVPEQLETTDISKVAQWIKHAISNAIGYEVDNDYREALESRRVAFHRQKKEA